ncbi:hypothetical protein HanRHA438_Chr17g0824091 [Helianthus annuus]|nr:hypothetical protein HanRHA438_Chr17g0824091 [Helianthus annuus]
MISHHKPKLSYQSFWSSCYDSNGQFGTHETTNYGVISKLLGFRYYFHIYMLLLL